MQLQNYANKHLLDLYAFLEQVSDFFKNELSAYERKVMTEIPPDYPSPLPWQMYEPQLKAASNDFEHIYPSIVFNSIVIVLYSIVEIELNRICAYLSGNSHGENVHIDGTVRYIKEHCHLSFPDDTEGWRQIQFIRKIRNSIVHNNSDLQHSKDASFLKYADNQGIMREKRIVLHKTYCSNAILAVMAFFKTLYGNYLR